MQRIAAALSADVCRRLGNPQLADVAHKRAAFREHPGARAVSIVGSSHKPWFDSLLVQIHGVDIVDVGQALE